MKRRTSALVGTLLVLGSAVAYGHERFIKHDLKHPLDPHFFIQGPVGFLGVNPNIWRIAANLSVILSAFLLIWFFRQPITEVVLFRLLGMLRGKAQSTLHALACFLTDRPVRRRWFSTFGEWIVIVFMRSPGLVLMYSASNDALVMPSFPLDPTSATFFKFAQVALALLILTQTLLPLCGAMILGTYIYLNRWGMMVAVDAMPVVSVAVLYLASPWSSHKVAITGITRTQVIWLRRVLGLGFFMLGWFKIYNHNLTAGVADNYPSSLNDPLLGLFTIGTDVAKYPRETWIVSFAMAEIMSGLLVMIGVFNRVQCSLMAFTFIKLMVVDFGWEEIAHIYPTGGVLSIIFSNRLCSDIEPLEKIEERLDRQGKTGLRYLFVVGVSLGMSVLILFPPLYVLSFFNRYGL